MKVIGVGVASILFGMWLLFPPIASAHLFGGPPFLSLNGKDALTNPIYMSLPSFTVPQDNAQGVYLVNQPITLVVALDKLPVPLEIAKQSTFRWHWDENDPTVTYGDTQTHTYSAIGTHLVTLDVEAPGETDYLTLDTVRVQVVPNLAYRLPTVSIEAVRDKFATNKPISFISKASTDPSTSIKEYTWDFGDNTSSHEANPSHVYQQNDFLDFAYVQVVDKNGFKAEGGVTAVATKGAIRLTPLVATSSSIPLVDPPAVSQSKGTHSSESLIALGVVLILVVAVVSLLTLVMTRQRRSMK